MLPPPAAIWTTLQRLVGVGVMVGVNVGITSGVLVRVGVGVAVAVNEIGGMGGVS